MLGPAEQHAIGALGLDAQRQRGARMRDVGGEAGGGGFNGVITGLL